MIGRAFEHPIREHILRRAAEDEITPKTIAKELGELTGTVGYHFTELGKLGLIVVTRTEPARGTLRFYWRIAPAAPELLEEHAARVRAFAQELAVA